MKSKNILIFFLIMGIIAVASFLYFYNIIETMNPSKPKAEARIDDWKYEQKDYDSVSGVFGRYTKATGAIDSANLSADESLGFTVGGAGDINNYRSNIENGYFPISSDITYNGIYSEYYFDSGKDEDNKKDDMFYPTYSTAISKDPFSDSMEKYISVGLNSNIKASDFKRDKLNLVVVLDISGSMSSGLTDYYYDFDEEESKEEFKTKMKLAEECINEMIDKLNDDDRLGIVLFDDEAYLGKELRLVGETDIEAIKDHILEIEPQGGTNFSAGYKEGTKLYKDYLDMEGYQNRIIVITDAMPNVGEYTSDNLMGLVKGNAKSKIYTSLIGVGVDFNTELIEEILDTEGANYHSVHDNEEFKRILADEFDYMVTPMVFDLDFSIESDMYDIENVYGTDSIVKEEGKIMHVNTLFPSSTNSSGEVKGGIIILKLKQKEVQDKEDDIVLKVTYKDKNKKEYTSEEKVAFKNAEEYYDNTGIEKGIALARYVNVIRDWILYERTNKESVLITAKSGIIECPDEVFEYVLGENERASTELSVSENYKEIFRNLKEYLSKEKDATGDDSIDNEIEILTKLIDE